MTRSHLEALDPEAATLLAKRALAVAGASDANAACTAGYLVDAELAGHPSHGLRLVPQYCELAGSDGHRLDAVPLVAEVRGALSIVDAAGGLGYPALELAVDAATATALEVGIGACSVVRCGHAGRAGAWAERAVAQGAAAIVMLGGVDPPFVMAAGPGSAASLHTNPVALGVPAEGPPVILDMATSLVAAGKVAIAASRGTALPEGSIVDRNGVVTADPAAFFDGGALLPFAGHKGFGLAALVEALSVSLTGADTSRPAEGALVICLDVGGFRPASEVRSAVETLRSRLHSSSGERDVLAPGEPEARARERDGATVLVERDLLDRLRQLAESAR